DEIVARLAFVPGIAVPGAVRARGGAVERAHTRDGWAPARQRAGLVEREDSRARELVEPGAAAHEHDEIRETRQRADDGDRDADDQRAWTRDDQEREAAVEPARGVPRRRDERLAERERRHDRNGAGEPDYGRRVPLREAVDEALG